MNTNGSSSKLNIATRKPHNYFNELSPEQQEERTRLDVMIAEAERYRKIGEDVNMFESFQRWLKTTESESRSIAKQRTRPSIEQVAIASGLIKIHHPMMGVKMKINRGVDN